MLICVQRKSAVVELLAKGADKTLRDKKGRSPYDLAKKSHYLREKLAIGDGPVKHSASTVTSSQVAPTASGHKRKISASASASTSAVGSSGASSSSKGLAKGKAKTKTAKSGNDMPSENGLVVTTKESSSAGVKKASGSNDAGAKAISPRSGELKNQAASSAGKTGSKSTSSVATQKTAAKPGAMKTLNAGTAAKSGGMSQPSPRSSEAASAGGTLGGGRCLPRGTSKHTAIDDAMLAWMGEPGKVKDVRYCEFAIIYS